MQRLLLNITPSEPSSVSDGDSNQCAVFPKAFVFPTGSTKRARYGISILKESNLFAFGKTS